MKCTYCESEHFFTEESNFPVEIKGEIIQVKSNLTKCDHCKNIVLDNCDMERMRVRAANKYKFHHWMTSSDMIRKLIKIYQKRDTPLHIVLGIEKKELQSYTEDQIQPLEVEFLLRKIISGMKRNYVNNSSAKIIPVDCYWISAISRIDKIPFHTPFIACVQDGLGRTKVVVLQGDSKGYYDLSVCYNDFDDETYLYEKKDIIAWMSLPENLHSKELEQSP
jgi:hypothetical protein